MNAAQQHTASIHVIASKTLGGLSIAAISNEDIDADIAAIKEIVSEEASVSLKDMESKSRKAGIVLARTLFYTVAYELLNEGQNETVGLQYLGDSFGQSHCNVHHLINKFRDEITTPQGAHKKQLYSLIRTRCSGMLGGHTITGLQRKLSQVQRSIKDLQERERVLTIRIQEYNNGNDQK